jgi:hypothetical protein
MTLLLLLASCGGGGNTVSPFETPTLTAYYVDAPVKGLIYEASPSGLHGVTDERGAFSFKRGDYVSFYIDQVSHIYIGKVQPTDGQVVTPAIANTYDPEVEASLVSLVLYSLDKSQLGASFMDLSDLVLNSSVAEKIRLFLSKKEMPNQITDVWQSLASLQSEASNYTFRYAGGGLSDASFRQHVFNSAAQISAVDIEPDDFLGVHAFKYGLTNVFLQFLSNGLVYSIRDDGIIASGTYSINGQSMKFKWDINPWIDCESSISLKQRGTQWSLLTIQETQTPTGCTSSPFVEVWSKAKINAATDISYVSGKTLRIPTRGICAFGDGEVVFSISSSGLTANQRNVDAISSICTGNQLISGVVKESGMPGVLIFEFDNASPRSKFFFSILQESGRALTQISNERTVPNVEFDFVYGAETTFVLE